MGIWTDGLRAQTPSTIRPTPVVAGSFAAVARPASTIRYIGKPRVTKPGPGPSWGERQKSLSTIDPNKDDQPMTTNTRIGLFSAAVVSLSLALAPAAFAQDKMGKDDGMKKDSMSKDSMSKDAMKKDDGMKKDAMKKDDGMMKDGMKKDDGMKKN
jgi:pentapeptide MXKDX repeat protein